MTDSAERRTNHALRRRIDNLIGRVHDARAEIVERGLDAVHDDDDDRDDAAGADGKLPPDGDSADGRP